MTKFLATAIFLVTTSIVTQPALAIEHKHHTKKQFVIKLLATKQAPAKKLAPFKKHHDRNIFAKPPVKMRHMKHIADPVVLPIHEPSILPASAETPKSYTDTTNIYAEAGANKLDFALINALPRVYVPNHASDSVTVINATTKQVVETYKAGRGPQHIIPSWDKKTLWVANNADHSTKGSMTPIDPWTGKAGQQITVDDPYNMYFMPEDRKSVV